MRFNTLLGCSPWVSQQGSIHNSPGPQSGPNGIVKHQHRSRRKTAECSGQTTGVKDPLAGNSKAGEHVNRSALASPFASCRMLFTGYSGCPPTAPPGAAALLQGSWASAARADRPKFTVLAVQWHPRRRGKARVPPGGASARSGQACHAGIGSGHSPYWQGGPGGRSGQACYSGTGQVRSGLLLGQSLGP